MFSYYSFEALSKVEGNYCRMNQVSIVHVVESWVTASSSFTSCKNT